MMEINECVYIGFAKQVVALDKATGTILWQWKIPNGKVYPAILVDGARLFVSAMGYTYCLDANTGRLLWENELPGMGTGVACIATANSNTNPSRAAHEVTSREQQESSHSSS